jgi:hypothetical protein
VTAALAQKAAYRYHVAVSRLVYLELAGPLDCHMEVCTSMITSMIALTFGSENVLLIGYHRHLEGNHSGVKKRYFLCRFHS